MDLHVTLDGRRDLSGQIYRRIREVILDGRLPSGAPVPPSRELARRLEVSRNTVMVAYDRLVAEGFLVGRVGAGTFVSDAVGPSPGVRRAPAGGGPRPRPVWSTLPEPPDMSAARPEFDFRSGLPDARLFPYQSWRRLVAGQLRPSSVGSGAYTDSAGHPGLRAAVARHVGVSRGVVATGDDVIVTSGLQQALDLLARVLLEPAGCVAVEDPGYPPPRALFESLGARVAPVPVDAEGLVVDALPADARMVYVTPSHQYPLGMPMSLARRMALLDWAARHGAVVIEDDYDSEFRYAGRPIEPLHTLDRHGLVVYAGSFSKVMLPTLRLGFLVAPGSLRRSLRVAKYVTDWHTALPAQGALARFIEEGALARHIRRMRGEYRIRHERIRAALAGELGRWLVPVPSAAGLHLSAVFRDGAEVKPSEVVRRARAAGVAVVALSVYTVGEPVRPGLVLGYGAIPTDRVDEGARRLCRCLSGRGDARWESADPTDP